jgi:hypothetical protein
LGHAPSGNLYRKRVLEQMTVDMSYIQTMELFTGLWVEFIPPNSFAKG